MKRLVARAWQNKVVSAIIGLALVVAVLGGVYHSQIIDGFISTRDTLVRTFAFGFIPPLSWAIALAVVFWRRRHLLARRFWNLWVAALVGAVTAWGAMGYLIGYEGILKEVSLGGRTGQAIKGASDVLGAVRLIALSALAIAIASPFGTLRALRGTGRTMGRLARKARQALPVAASGARAIGRTLGRTFSLLRRVLRRKEKDSVTTITVQNAPVPRPPERSPASRRGPQAAQAELVQAVPLPRTSASAKPLADEPVVKPARDAPAGPAPRLSTAPAAAEGQRPPIAYVPPAELARWSLPAVTLLTESPPGSHEPGIDTEATSDLIETTLGRLRHRG